jgi:hypothetical protein
VRAEQVNSAEPRRARSDTPYRLICVVLACASFQASAQAILFDFENAPLYTPLPLEVTVGGLTAHFSATGQGFSIQRADTMGFTPVGFSGNCIYPSSVFASDLMIGFSQNLNGFSILYAPQELGCDTSATMRVTAYLDGVLVGTATTNASSPGTWPSEILAFSSSLPFNSVTVHYDTRPACQDWGPIFMADNVVATLAPPPIVLTGLSVPPGGGFQFFFAGTPGASFAVLAAVDPTLPLTNWTTLGNVTEIAAGQFQFVDTQTPSAGRRFYRVRSQ